MAASEVMMSDKVYKRISLVGCAESSIEDAVRLAIAKASETLRGLAWFEVKEIRGSIRDGKPTEWQVSLEAGFKLD
jgi:flavin-binding protein dodecin